MEAMLHKTQISCLQMNIDSKDFGLMRILNSVEFVFAFPSKWIFSNISIFIMILAIENLVWMEPKQVNRTKTTIKTTQNLYANMLLKFVSPVVVVSILTENDETWYNYIATTHSTKSVLSFLGQINKCIYFVITRFTMHTLLRGSNWEKKTNNERKFNKQMHNAQQMKWKIQYIFSANGPVSKRIWFVCLYQISYRQDGNGRNALKFAKFYSSKSWT